MKNIHFIFIALSFVAFFLVHYIIFRTFSVIFAKNFSKSFAFLLLFISLCELYFLANLRSDMDRNLYIFFASLIGLSFMMFVVSLVYMFVYLGIEQVPFSKPRREAIVKIFNTFTIFSLILYMIGGFWEGFSTAKIKRVKVKIKNLKKPLNIVHITDVHIGKFLQYNFLKNIVQNINELNPDMVAITGDLVDFDINKAKEFLAPLKDLKPKYGVYFVVGNHEYYHGVEPIIKYLKSLGLKVLENENIQIAGVNIAGIYDLDAKRLNHHFLPDLNLALKNRDESLPTILLSHQPKITNYLTISHKVDLILSGHTHGGQIFPFGFLVSLVQPYLHGLYKHSKNTQIYVSSGVGFWGPPIRFLAPAEIVSLELE